MIQYSTEEEAEETRAALHGIHWPTSNPKTLVVDYSTAEELENRLSGKEVPAASVGARIDTTVRAAAAAVQSVEGRRDGRTEGSGKAVREWDLGKVGQESASDEQQKEAAKEGADETADKIKDGVPAKLLDDLFRKTKTTPCIYWLPLTAAQIAEKEEMRRKRLAERETRAKEAEQRRNEEAEQRQREREKQRDAERERQKARERERERERERDRDRQRRSSRKRSRSVSSSSSSSSSRSSSSARSVSSSPNKRTQRASKSPPRKR